MRSSLYLSIALFVLAAPGARAIMERGDYPWNVELRSWHDAELGHRQWHLNLGPTGIRARIDRNAPNQFVVTHVFAAGRLGRKIVPASPAWGKVNIGDIIVGANGRQFRSSHRFGRNLPGGGGWDGPLMELAGHIEASQGGDGTLRLMVRSQSGNAPGPIKTVEIQLKPVGRFSPTFPYNCPRTERLLEELCDFIVRDYEEGNWKGKNSFYGGPHGEAHQLLALMASGFRKYEPIVEKYRRGFYGNRYRPEDGGFRMWRWGFDSILMGEMYHLKKDRRLIEPMESLAKAMPWGSQRQNGIYTHRSYINIRNRGGKPYASIAAISGLQMIGMSIFRHLELYYDEDLHETIYQHYLRSARDKSLSIAYAFPSQQTGIRGRDPRHAVIELKNPAQAKSERGPGHVVPSGMKDITEYTIIWPTKSDHRYKPTDWLEKERDQNIVEFTSDTRRRVDRFLGDARGADPTRPYRTSGSGGHLAPVGMGAVALLMGNPPRKGWEYVGTHAANTCVLGPGNIFDGHAASNLHGFWSILGAARSDKPRELQAFYDYLKTFIILGQTHDGNGIYMQPWGRDRPNSNSDVSYGPRILPTATAAIMLALPRKRLLITGADKGKSATPYRVTASLPRQPAPVVSTPAPTPIERPAPTPVVRPAPTPVERPVQPEIESVIAVPKSATQPETDFKVPEARQLRSGKSLELERGLLSAIRTSIAEAKIQSQTIELERFASPATLIEVKDPDQLVFRADGAGQAVRFRDLSAGDCARIARLLAELTPDNHDLLAMAGVYLESANRVFEAKTYFGKAGEDARRKYNGFFE